MLKTWMRGGERRNQQVSAGPSGEGVGVLETGAGSRSSKCWAFICSMQLPGWPRQQHPLRSFPDSSVISLGRPRDLGNSIADTASPAAPESAWHRNKKKLPVKGTHKPTPGREGKRWGPPGFLQQLLHQGRLSLPWPIIPTACVGGREREWRRDEALGGRGRAGPRGAGGGKGSSF